jgi:hypothetical protein
MATASSAGAASWIGRIEPGWLTEVLQAAGATTDAVIGVQAAPLEVPGAAGDLARLSLSYKTAGSPGPATVIAKAPGSSPTQQAMDHAMGLFSREQRVYAELSHILPVRLPRCYHVGHFDKAEPLLLEDLHDLRMGDQLAGLIPSDAERLVDLLADLHAAFWDREPPVADRGWLVSWSDPAFGAILTQLVTSGVATLRARYADRLPVHVLNTAERVAPDWEMVLRRCAEGPQTLVHNDFRLDNLFFRPDGEPVVIDWQLAGRCRGTQDLAYLLSSSMATATVRTWWEPLLRRYHARLSAAGVRGYDLEQCRFHYRQSLLYTLAPGIAMLGQMQLGAGDARGLADTLVLRTFTHAADLDAFATL